MSQVRLHSILPGLLINAQGEFIWCSPFVSILMLIVLDICSLWTTMIKQMIVAAGQVSHITVCRDIVERTITNLESRFILIWCIGRFGGRHGNWRRQISFFLKVLLVRLLPMRVFLLNLDHIIRVSNALALHLWVFQINFALLYLRSPCFIALV